MTRAASKSGSDKSKASAALSVPSMKYLSFLGAPPLIPGEFAGDYEKLVSAVTNTMKPADFMETIRTRDIVDLQWDIIRFRRIKADLHSSGQTLYREVERQHGSLSRRRSPGHRRLASEFENQF